MQMKKAFAGDHPCDAEAALIEDHFISIVVRVSSSLL